MSRCFLLLVWLTNIRVAYFQESSNTTTIRSRLFGISSLDAGPLEVPVDTTSSVLLFGIQLNISKLTFTRSSKGRNEDCDNLDHTSVYSPVFVEDGVSRVDVLLPPGKGSYYICLYQDGKWLHQGNESYIHIGAKTPLVPIWASVLIIILLLSFSGLFSGLNLGLMSLDKNDLQVIARCGTEIEKRYARIIEPVRKRGNYLLCSILLGNVFVNNTLTLFMEDLTSGIVSAIASTLAIVIFGEIVPQAACSRHGLAVGAKTITFTYVFMFLTFPLSFPISKILDFILGDEIGHVYDRERLMEYIKVTKTYNKLEEDEVNIIAGALNLKNKTVGEIMTRLEDVFMLPLNALLDFNTVSEISKRGYSRIPVYEGDRKNIVALLHAKDLAFVDPDDNKPLKTHVEFYRHQLVHTYEEESLFNLLNDLRLGKSHMAFVRKIFTFEDEDPYYELTGVVTLEDIIEEILQMEIVDETDTLVDNRKKQRRKGADHQDFTDFVRIGAASQGTHDISSQLALATFQYLSTAVEPFKKPLISETVLRRLLAQKIYFFIKNIKDDDPTSQREQVLYVQGKPADYFIMILEGKAQVTIGSEGLTFDAGPFAFFGTSSLGLTPNDLRNITRPPTPDSPKGSSELSARKSDAGLINPEFTGPTMTAMDTAIATVTPSETIFKPDYTVKLIEPTLYMKVTRQAYLAAFRASMMEQEKQFSTDEEKLKKEIDIVFNRSFNDNKQSASLQQLQQLQLQSRDTNARSKAKNSSTTSLSPLVRRREPSPPGRLHILPRRKSSATIIKPPLSSANILNKGSKSPPLERKAYPLQPIPPESSSPKRDPSPKSKSSKSSGSPPTSSTRFPFGGPSDHSGQSTSGSPPDSPKEDSHLINKK